MRLSLLNIAKERLMTGIQFIEAFGYRLSNISSEHDHQLSLIYYSDDTKKEICFTIHDAEDLKRFFITTSITRQPYDSIDDYNSYDYYLTKNQLLEAVMLIGPQIHEQRINRYVDEYTGLFSRYAKPLIESNEQFKGLFPDWR